MNSSVIASGSFVLNPSPLDSCALEVLLISENVHALALLAQGSEIDLFKLILASSIISKAVLLILLFFSVFSWAIIFKKFVVIRKRRRDSETFIRMFRKSKRFSEISTACESLRNTPLVEVFLAGYEELEAQLLPDGKTHGIAASPEPRIRRHSRRSMSFSERSLARRP